MILTAKWSGELVLVRALGGWRQYPVLRTVLNREFRDPDKRLRQALAATASRDLAHGAVVNPDDLWLTNGVDPVAFLDELRADGVRLITLTRRRHADRGLSRARCGPDLEILPFRRCAVAADQVALYAVPQPNGSALVR
ncbi:MAG: hypothetical protein ACRD0G_10565 [Acidimicrobiales bacterium]